MPGYFSAEEATTIRRHLSSSGGPVACPRCSVFINLIEFDFAQGAVGFYWVYRCPRCARHLLVLDLASTRQVRVRATPVNGAAAKPAVRKVAGRAARAAPRSAEPAATSA